MTLSLPENPTQEDLSLISMKVKKLISKDLKLGRLESSEEFKEKKSQQKKTEETEIEKLKITVRDINEDDINQRSLPKDTKGVVIVEISNRSPLSRVLSVNNIILEVQKKSINSNSLDQLVGEIIKKGEQTLLLTIINNNGERRYLGVKIN